LRSEREREEKQRERERVFFFLSVFVFTLTFSFRCRLHSLNHHQPHHLVADVGLSKILRDRFLSTMQAVGTFAWAAPEVLLGKPTSESADVYSFGVLLWELSTGEAPPGRALREIEVPEEAPQEVADLISRCMDEEPTRRPTALELVHFFKDLDVATVGGASSQRSTSNGGGGGAGAPTEGNEGGGGSTLAKRLSNKLSKKLSNKESKE